VELGLVEGVGLVGYYILEGRAHIIRIIEAGMRLTMMGIGNKIVKEFFGGDGMSGS